MPASKAPAISNEARTLTIADPRTPNAADAAENNLHASPATDEMAVSSPQSRSITGRVSKAAASSGVSEKGSATGVSSITLVFSAAAAATNNMVADIISAASEHAFGASQHGIANEINEAMAAVDEKSSVVVERLGVRDPIVDNTNNRNATDVSVDCGKLLTITSTTCTTDFGLVPVDNKRLVSTQLGPETSRSSDQSTKTHHAVQSSTVRLAAARSSTGGGRSWKVNSKLFRDKKKKASRQRTLLLQC